MSVTSITVACDRCGKQIIFDSEEECMEYFREKETYNTPKAFLMEDYYGNPVQLCLGCANRLYKWFECTSYRMRLRRREENRKNLHANNETNIEGGTQHEEESFV